MNDMKGKHEKKTDLLDLPIAERKRLCFEIRAALRERVSVSNSSFPDETKTVSKLMRESLPIKPFDECEMNAAVRRSPARFGSVPKKP
jgi:hypothetical protein